MIAQAIIWALVLALFGTNGDSVKIQRMTAVAKTICRSAGTHQQFHNGDVTVKTRYAASSTGTSRSGSHCLVPVIGILLGIFGVFLLYH
jgi:hypothetical protein